MSRLSEQELVLPSLYLMSISHDGFIFTYDFKKKLAELLKPTGEDAETSPSRPAEIKFMQIVGNLKSHNTFNKNGFATYKKVGNDGGFEITEKGKIYLIENYTAIKYLIVNDFNWDGLQSGLIEFEKSKVDKRTIQVFDENIIINEGIKKIKEVNIYERSSKLREYAIAHFTVSGKINCNCCSFNFEYFYGNDIGKGFIEIHHTKPIFKYEDEDLETTIEKAINNLTPVCSNCHRMIHRNWNKPLEIQTLINSINANGMFKR